MKNLGLACILILFGAFACSKEEVPGTNTQSNQQGGGVETDEIRYLIKIDYTFSSKEKADSLISTSKETEVILNVPIGASGFSGARQFNDDILLEEVEHLLYSLDCQRRIGGLHIDVSKTVNGEASDIDLKLVTSGIPTNFSVYNIDENGDRIPVEVNGELLCTENTDDPSSCSFDCEFEYSCEAQEELGNFKRELRLEISDGQPISMISVPTLIEVKDVAVFVKVTQERDRNPVNDEIVENIEVVKRSTYDIFIDRIHVKGSENCSQKLATVDLTLPIEQKNLIQTVKIGERVHDFDLYELKYTGAFFDRHYLIDVTREGDLKLIPESESDYDVENQKIAFPIDSYYPEIRFSFYYNCDKANNYVGAASADHIVVLTLVKDLGGAGDDFEAYEVFKININLHVTLQE